MFGIEPDESVPTYGADEEADDADDMLDDEDDLTDDELFNIDPSKLKAGADGIRILAEFTLECKEKPMGVLRQMFPVRIDEEFIKNRVYVLINIPFVLSIPLAEVTPDSEYSEMSGTFLTDMTTAYKIPEDAYAELNEILDRCGVPNAQKEIKEGEDVVARISEYFASGDVIDTDFAPREDGYYEDTMEYWYEGDTYHEMDVIWFELPRNVDANGRMRAMCINLDSFPDLCEPCDITRAKTIKVENFRRVLSEEERVEIIRYGRNPEFFERLLPEEMVWFLASEYAKKQETSGYCVVCKNGKFNVPVESIFNPTTLEYEHLVIAFNSMPCGEDHHKCTGVLVADVGNIQMYTAVRYHKNQVIDWRKRINQELQAIFLKNPNFDMYADPYDDPHNAYGDETPT